MKSLIGSLLALALIVGFVGCGEETSVTEETTVTTPDGEVTRTDETTIETEGDATSFDLEMQPEPAGEDLP